MAKNKKHIFDIEKLNIEKINKELLMSYDTYVKYLLDKYGPATCDYFRTNTCKSKNPNISRVEEGLYCHHIDEDKAIMLSTSEVAQLYPFEYQKANRLVYCNILEHLLLHIKIAEERKDVTSEVGIGGTALITEEINMHITKGYSNSWRKKTMKIIDENYTEYIYVLSYLRKFLRNDPLYCNHPLFQNKFLCFNGNDFNRKIWDDLVMLEFIIRA